MKIYFRCPSEGTLSLFLKKKQFASYSYQALEGTKTTPVKGYDNDHKSILLGQGDEVWNKAKVALNQWQQFPPSWTKIYDTSTAPSEGNTVAVLFRLFGLWWVNSARVVYTFDEANRYGFAYGTLQGHVERGEECFWIERDQAGNIYYHIKAFSKPAFWGAKLIYPIAREYQRKFVRESMQLMKRLAKSIV